MRRRRLHLALAGLIAAAAVTAGAVQPTFILEPGESKVDVAPTAATTTYTVGHHSDCGHGCVWQRLDGLTCPAGQVPTVTVTNVSDATAYGKGGYWLTPAQANKAKERNTDRSQLQLAAGCATP